MNNAVTVKSFQNGIALYLDADIDFEELLRQTGARFSQSDHFFQDASVAVSFEGRSLSFEQEARIVSAIEEHSSLNIACIVGKEEDNGLYVRALGEARALSRKGKAEEQDGRFYRGTLRKGQILETESSIIVLGDVEAGASVIAAGSIVVLGRLSGRAYAGGREYGGGACTGEGEYAGGACAGGQGSYIAALEMTPQKLKIGAFKYIAEEKKKRPFWGAGEGREADPDRLQPKMAYVEKDSIILRPITKESLNSLEV